MDAARRWLKLIAMLLEKAPPLSVGLAMAVAGAVGMYGMITYNQANLFCLKCHAPNGIFNSFEESTVAHTPYKKDGARCLSCHTDKDFYDIAASFVRETARDFTHVTNAEAARLPDLDPGYTDADCLKCHYDVMKLDGAEKLELPPKLAEIGLRFSHRRHFWIKEFPPEARARLTELRALPTPTKEQQDEIDFLYRAQLGWCGQCHDRRQPTAEGGERLDRSINYFSLNPMACVGCHLDARRARHPGTIHLALPREETCRRCHSGSFHGRFTTFRAECESDDKRDCARCHPQWKPPEAALSLASEDETALEE
jgi:hypothetical protein